MVKILTDPKNAIIKQYQKLLELDEVNWSLRKEHCRAIAKKALEKNTAPGPCAQSSKSLCWISCLRFQKMSISETVKITEDYHQ